MKILVLFFALVLCEISLGHVLESVEKNIEADPDLEINEINKKIHSRLVDGDILPEKSSRNTITDPNRWWLSTNIPVTYIDQLNLEAVESINEARLEYEMRTCLKFIDRTNQNDFITFQALGGCYSDVGRSGGNQTISIGSGCEKRSIVQHEMMHAIGIWHEQSRTDRDDYVKIHYEDIEAGKENNFNKYGYDISSPLRVPYDYNSIMHYSDTSFSDNGDPTIVTRDLYYQDIIGQRRTFSKGDTTKINRMYNCSDTLRITSECNFERQSICGFNTQMQGNMTMHGNWTRFKFGVSTAHSQYVPSNDNTFAKDGIGSIMLFQPTNEAGKFAEVKSMRYLSNTNVQCLRFNYFFNLVTGSTAKLQIYIAKTDMVDGSITSMGEPVATITKNTGDYWQFLAMNINAPSEYKVVIRGTSGGYLDDGIAFDDFSIQDKPCDTGYYSMDDFDKILENTTKGERYYSPTMYTDDGYAYFLKIYPQGTDNSLDGYLGLYLGLTVGENDDELTWPMCNRFVRLQITDQNYNPLYGMDQYSNYLTSTSSTWDQPTTEHGTVYGYRNFIKITDLQNLNNYMKHNKVIFSAKIKDMNYQWGTNCMSSSSKQLPENKKESRMAQPKTRDLKHEENTDLEDEEEIPTVSAFATALIAVGCSMIVFVIMSALMMYVIAIHQQRLVSSAMKNPVVVMTNPQEKGTAMEFVNKAHEP